MNEQIRQIADRIRGLRDIAQLSPETCAQDLGIPAETYRSYESGEADIPASFLYQVAGKFHVELSVPAHGRGAAAAGVLGHPRGPGRQGGPPQGLRLPEPRLQLRGQENGAVPDHRGTPPGVRAGAR